MNPLRIALGNVKFPTSREASVTIVQEAMKEASDRGAHIICFPECIVPGYRLGQESQAPDQSWLESAWNKIDILAGKLNIGVILGTERIVDDRLRITVRVTDSEGQCLGFQDKVQLDPSEESTYSPGNVRRIFKMGDLKFGVVICHEGWRYPETVRWAAVNGAQMVFHPHIEIAGETQSMPSTFCEQENSFHEKAALCRAAENTCYFATVNCALTPGTLTTSAFINPEGELMSFHPYGKEGVLIQEIDLSVATRLLAKRLKPSTAKG